MSTLWNNSQQTVRRRASVKTIGILSLLAFCAASLATYSVGLRVWVPANPHSTYTATVEVVERSAAHSSSECRTPFTYTDTMAELATVEANALAERHVSERRAEWLAQAEKPLQTARQNAEKARQAYASVVTQLAVLQQQLADAAKAMAETKSDTKPLAPPEPTTVENPQWRELEEKLASLQQQQEQLLIERTPQHPAVREVVYRMADVRAQMADIPPRIPVAQDEPSKAIPQPAQQERVAVGDVNIAPNAGQPIPQDQKKLAELSAAVTQASHEYDDADLAVILAEQSLANEPTFVVLTTQILEQPPKPDVGWHRLLATTLATGLLMAFGLGSFAMGTSIEPPVANAAQLKTDLHLPILGVVPATHPVANPAGMHDRQSQLRHILIVLGLILLCACPLAAIVGIHGI